MKRLVFALVCLTCVCLTWIGASAPVQAFDEKVLDGVVSVLPERTGVGTRPGPQGSGRHLAAPEGSGVALFDGRFIATNDHVIGQATTVRVRHRDGRIVPAMIVGRDPETDIALLKIEDALPALERGPRPKLGAKVCTIGNQFGLGLSLTCGIVSAPARTGVGFNPIEDFIQTDASVNPGGSGGALIDADGRLVGMVSAIFTKSSDADIGVNFATSLDLLMRITEDLRDKGNVARAALPVTVVALPHALRAQVAGAFVSEVPRDSDALEAGLEAGDVITALNGRTVQSLDVLNARLGLLKPRDQVLVTRWRNGGTVTLSLTLSER